MQKDSDDILVDIDATLNQLIENAEALKAAKMSHFFDHEIDFLERTQESLLARLIHKQEAIETARKKKNLESLRKEAVIRKVVEYAKVFKTARRTPKRNKRLK